MICLTKSYVLSQLKYYRGILILLLLASVLILYHISDQCLWNDEAQTANIAYNTMKYGYPTIYDGRNLLSTADGNNFNDKLVISNYEWLQFYITAASFRLLGKTVLAARLPFALFGIASILLVWMLADRIYHSRKKANAIAVIYCLNVQFLLYCRQARYYTLAMFFTALATLLFFDLLDLIGKGSSFKDKRLIRKAALLTLSVACNMHSSRLFGLVWLFAMFFYLLILRKVKIFLLLLPVGAGALTWGVWFFFTNIAVKAPSFGTGAIETHFAVKILLILWKLQVYFLPFLSLILIYLLFLFLQRIFYRRQSFLEWEQKHWFFVLLVAGNILATTLSRWGIINHYYLAVLVAAPFLIYPVLEYVWKSSRTMCVALFLVMVTTNLLNIWPYYLVKEESLIAWNESNNMLSEGYTETTNIGIFASPDTNSNFRISSLSSYLKNLRIRSYFYDYFRELSSDYYCYVDEIVEIFEEHGVKGDNVAVVGFEYNPYIFHSDVRIVNNLNPKLIPWPDYFTAYPNQKKYGHLTYIPDYEIDWLIVKGDGWLGNYVDDAAYFNEDRFEIIRTTTMDAPLANSPDLDIHNFVTVTKGQPITIMRRKP